VAREEAPVPHRVTEDCVGDVVGREREGRDPEQHLIARGLDRVGALAVLDGASPKVAAIDEEGRPVGVVMPMIYIPPTAATHHPTVRLQSGKRLA
jgi:hypothetical protein